MKCVLIDDYINEVTKDIELNQQGEVAKELRTHILDSADALAAERKTAIDDAILREVIANMGPAGHLAAMYQKPKSFDRLGRPKIVPPPTKMDLVIEAIALTGLLLNLGFVLNGIINFLEIIPTHIGLSGGIDSYGDKWVPLLIFTIINVITYILLTIVNRYPYVFNYPVIVTEENASRLYPMARRMMRIIKAILVWMFTFMAWEFIGVSQNNPGESGGLQLITIVSSILLPILIVYYIIKIKKVSESRIEAVDL